MALIPSRLDSGIAVHDMESMDPNLRVHDLAPIIKVKSSISIRHAVERVHKPWPPLTEAIEPSSHHRLKAAFDSGTSGGGPLNRRSVGDSDTKHALSTPNWWNCLNLGSPSPVVIDCHQPPLQNPDWHNSRRHVP